MLKTCLKYDFKSVMRLWWILAVSMAGAAVIAGLGLRFFTQCTIREDVAPALSILSIFAMFGSMLCLFAMIAGTVISFILVFWRMYTHFYTDEGYLTFTLPVKRSTLYLSKVIMGTVVQAATLLIVILGILFVVMVAVPTEGGEIFNSMIFEEIFTSLSDLWQTVGWWLWLWIPLILVLLVLYGLWANGLIYLCITIGAVVAKKHKLLAAIGIYYLVNSMVSFVMQMIGVLLSSGVTWIFVVTALKGGITLNLTVTIVLLIAVCLLACMAATLHFITINKLERKLNLA